MPGNLVFEGLPFVVVVGDVVHVLDWDRRGLFWSLGHSFDKG